MQTEEIIRTAELTFGAESQKAMAIEECAELINALSKEKRGRVSDEDVITEIADVMIMCEQLAEILGHSSIDTTRIYLQKSLSEQRRDFNKHVDW